MIDLSKEIPYENLTQKDIMQFLLHSTQHVATREELSSVKMELKQEITDVNVELKQDMDARFDKMDVKFDKIDARFDKQDEKISKISEKFDKILWLIIATTVTILLKEKILSLLGI